MTAPRRVLSDKISRAIGGRRVTAAVFTTFSFDPAFFELEILPLLFESRIGGGFSQIEKVRRVQLEECLRGGAEIEVYYDRAGLVPNAGPASLDFRRIDVGRRTGVFHPKLVLILVENRSLGDKKQPTHSLIVATLSANLTRAGWWENLEAGHLEVIDTKTKKNWRCTFRSDLLHALRLLANAAPPDDSRGALRTIRRFVQESAPQYSTKQARWKGSYFTRLFAGQRSLHEWIQRRHIRGRDWNLEVVSPFFDAHGARALKRLIEAVRPGEVRVFLPCEADGTPSVTSEQYEAVAAIAKWSRLPAGITRAARRPSSAQATPRRVHAKVYRFWHRIRGDVSLVGSPNATMAAHSDANAGNLEAAFLANTTGRADPGEWWLAPIDDPPTRFLEDPSEEDGDVERVGLALSLRYHWERHALEYRLSEDYDGDIRLRTIAGEELHSIGQPVQGEWTDCGSGAADEMKKLLGSSSFVEARIRTENGQRRWRVLVREEGMTHKPSLFTQLTPDEILQYWSLLSDSQRQAFIVKFLETDQALLSGKNVIGPRRPNGDYLFDRFAGIFHAFEMFLSWVIEKFDQDRHVEVTARLFGKKYDSLPVLLREVAKRAEQATAATENDGGKGAERDGIVQGAKLDSVTAWVTFLSAKKLVAQVSKRYPCYWAQHAHDARKLELAMEAANGIRAKILLTDPDRERFLNWYEETFLNPTDEDEGDDDE